VIRQDVEDLLQLIDAFVTGRDQSKHLAGQIEGLVLECFAGEPWFDEVSLALAQYAPGGGAHMYDEDGVSSELLVARNALRSGCS
jgi:hypothetical protein